MTDKNREKNFVRRTDLCAIVHIIVLQVTHLAVKQTSGGFTCWLVSIFSQGNYQTFFCPHECVTSVTKTVDQGGNYKFVREQR
jgi:hypothetical protein